MKVRDASEARRIEGTPTSGTPKAAPPATQTVDDRISNEAQEKVDAAVTAARRATGESRAARLAELEAEIRNGTFQPDPQRLARRILQEAEVSVVLHALLRP